MKHNYTKTQKFSINLVNKYSDQKNIKHALTLITLCLTLCIQAQFTEQIGTNNPFDGFDAGILSAPNFVDLDNDGDLDLVSGVDDGTFKYYENIGSNTFTLQTGISNPFDGIDIGGYSSPNLVDLDADGDLDLVTGGTNGTIKYYRNDLSAGFTQLLGTNNPFDGIDVGHYSSPTLIDLDSDNDLDLVSGNNLGTFQLYLNNGSNVFTEQSGVLSPLFELDAGLYSTPVFVDLDDDGDLDLVSGNSAGTFPLYLNNGSNVFTEQPGALSPLFGLDVGIYSTPVFVDLDNDGDLDIISGESNGTFKYYRNDGALSIDSENLDNLQFMLYPNPANTILNIELQTPLKQIDIYNLQGQNVMQSFSTQVNVSSFPNGIYLIKIEDENGAVSTKRFVKQ